MSLAPIPGDTLDVVTVLPTPFDRNDQVDAQRLRQLLLRPMPAGALAVGMEEGEFASLSTREYLGLIELAAAAGGREGILARVSASSTRLAVALAKDAAAAGAVQLVLTAPYYWKLKPDDIRRYVCEAAAASDLPVILWNAPEQNRGTGFSPALVMDLVARGAVAALLDSERRYEPFALLHAAARQARPDLRIYCHGLYLLPAMLMGVNGMFTSMGLLAPDLVDRLASLAATRAFDSLRAEQERALPLATLLLEARYLKVALASCGADVGGPRRPLTALGGAEAAILQATLAKVINR
jgi:4-hydroxy-tetrahydrodipicolinate synthase